MPNSQKSGKGTNTFQIKTEDGHIFEATRQTGTEWLITFPEGDRRFDGTVGEVKAFIRRLMKDVAQSEAEELARESARGA